MKHTRLISILETRKSELLYDLANCDNRSGECELFFKEYIQVVDQLIALRGDKT